MVQYILIITLSLGSIEIDCVISETDLYRGYSKNNYRKISIWELRHDHVISISVL